MGITYITSAQAHADTASVASLTIQIPAEVQYGDIMLLTVGSERSGLPTLTAPSAGLTTVEALVNATANSSTKAWKRINFDDLGGNVVASMAANRRMAMALSFYRGAKDPVFTHTGLVVNSNGDLTAEHPAVTPAENDSMLVSMMAAYNSVSPYPRTYTSAAGWNQRVESKSSAPANDNGFAVHADKLLSGGAGVSQTGNVVTDADQKFIYYATSVVLAPAPAIPDGWDELRLFTRE